MALRHVYQNDDSNDCGVAVVAMMGGVDLEKAREAFKDDIRSGTKPTQVLHALHSLGVSLPERPTVIRYLPADPKYRRRPTLEAILKGELKRDALMKLIRSDHKGGRWHWVVWDADRKKILDPWRPGAKRLARITSYREVID